jgi:LamB/YcsF family
VAVYRVPVYACKNQTQKEMCAKYGVPFQEELYVDIDYNKEGGLVPVAKSKQATPEISFNRVQECALKDKRDRNEAGVLKIGFARQPFSICLHSDMPTALEDVKAARKAVDEVNLKLFSNIIRSGSITRCFYRNMSLSSTLDHPSAFSLGGLKSTELMRSYGMACFLVEVVLN